MPFFYSLFGMVAIWMVYDLGEHANDFQKAHLGFEEINKFYLVRSLYRRQLAAPCVWRSLYVLTRMSRNEIVSMLGAGGRGRGRCYR
jgi:hypothetical protein